MCTSGGTVCCTTSGSCTSSAECCEGHYCDTAGTCAPCLRADAGCTSNHQCCSDNCSAGLVCIGNGN
jgi:hypothetical protein